MYISLLTLYFFNYFFRFHFREFGYISRNPLTNKHVCHVFVCDIAAMGIAQAMLDSHGVSSKGKLSGMSRRSSMAGESVNQ